MDSIAGQPSPATHSRGLASRFSAIRKAVSSRDLHSNASPRSSGSSGYEVSNRPSAPEPRHGRRPSVDYIPYTGPITQPPAPLPVLPQPNVGPTLTTSVEPFFGRRQPLSSRARSGSASSPFVGPFDPRAAPPWAHSLIGGMAMDDTRFSRPSKSNASRITSTDRDTAVRVADQELSRIQPSVYAPTSAGGSRAATKEHGIAFPTPTGRPSMGEGLPTAYSHFNYGYKAAESEPYMPASMRSDVNPVRTERSLIAGREFAPAGFTYRPAAQSRTPVTTSQLYKPRSRDSNDQRLQTPPGRTSIRTVGSTGTMGGESSGSAMSTSTSMTSLQGASSAHHKQISSSSLASSQRELRSAASVPNLKRVTHRQTDSAPATMPSRSQEHLSEAEKVLPALPSLKPAPLNLRNASQKPTLSPVEGSSLQGSAPLSQIDSNGSASAQRRYFLLQQLHLDELAAHSPDATGYLVPDNNCEKVFVPKPRLRHNSTDSKRSLSRDSQIIGKGKASQALPVFERNRPIPPLVIVGRNEQATNSTSLPGGGSSRISQTAFTHMTGAPSLASTLAVPHRDGSVRTPRAVPASGSHYVYDADVDAEINHLRAQALRAESADADSRPFFHHRMPPAPPQPDDRARARDSIIRPKTPKGGWGVLAHRQRTPSGNMLRAASQERVPAVRPFSPEDDDLDVQTVLAQGAALDLERDTWRRQHQRSLGASSAPSWARRDLSVDHRGRTNSGRLGARELFGSLHVDARALDDAHLDPRGGELSRSPVLGFDETDASATLGHTRQLSAFQQGQQQHQRKLRQARSSPQLGSASQGRFDTPSPALPSGAACVPGWLIHRPTYGVSRRERSQSRDRPMSPTNKVRAVRKKLSGRNLCGNNKIRSRASPSPPSSPTQANRDAVRVAAHRRMRTSNSFDVTVMGRDKDGQNTLQLPGDDRLRRNSWRASNLHDPPSSDGHGSVGRRPAERIGAVLMHEEPFVITRRDSSGPRQAPPADFHFPARRPGSASLQARRSGAETTSDSNSLVGIALPSPPRSQQQHEHSASYVAGRHPTSPAYHRPSNSADIRAALRAKEMAALAELSRPSPVSGRPGHSQTSSGSIAGSLDSSRAGTVTPPKRKSSLSHKRSTSKNKSSELSLVGSSEDSASTANFLAGIFRNKSTLPSMMGPVLQSSPVRSDFPRDPASLPVPPRKRPSIGTDIDSHSRVSSNARAPQLPPLSLDNLRDTMARGSEPFRTPTLPPNSPRSPLDYGGVLQSATFRTPLVDLDTPVSTAESYFTQGITGGMNSSDHHIDRATTSEHAHESNVLAQQQSEEVVTPPTPQENARADSDIDDASVIDPRNTMSPRSEVKREVMAEAATSPTTEQLVNDAESPLSEHGKFRRSGSQPGGVFSDDRSSGGRSGLSPSPNADGSGLLRSNTGQSKYRGHSAASSESNFTLTSIAPKELWNMDQEDVEYDDLFFRRGGEASGDRPPSAASELVRSRRSVGRSDGSGNGISTGSEDTSRSKGPSMTSPHASYNWTPHRDEEIPALPTSPQKFLADIHPPTPVLKGSTSIQPGNTSPWNKASLPTHQHNVGHLQTQVQDVQPASTSENTASRQYRIGRVAPPTLIETSPPFRRSGSFTAEMHGGSDLHQQSAPIKSVPHSSYATVQQRHDAPSPRERLESTESDLTSTPRSARRREFSSDAETGGMPMSMSAFVPAPPSSGSVSPELTSVRTSLSSYAPSISTDTVGPSKPRRAEEGLGQGQGQGPPLSESDTAKASQGHSRNTPGRSESVGTVVSGYSLGSADEEALSRVIHGEWPEPAEHGNTRRWI